MVPPLCSKWLSKYCSVYILETNKAGHLIFGTDTPWGLVNKMFQSEHQVAPHPQVAPPTCKNKLFDYISETIKVREFIFGIGTS